MSLLDGQLLVFRVLIELLCFLFQTEGGKLQKDLKAYLVAVKSECVCIRNGRFTCCSL